MGVPRAPGRAGAGGAGAGRGDRRREPRAISSGCGPTSPSLGPEMLREFDRTTARPGVPVVELERVAVPGGEPRTAVEGVV